MLRILCWYWAVLVSLQFDCTINVPLSSSVHVPYEQHWRQRPSTYASVLNARKPISKASSRARLLFEFQFIHLKKKKFVRGTKKNKLFSMFECYSRTGAEIEQLKTIHTSFSLSERKKVTEDVIRLNNKRFLFKKKNCFSTLIHSFRFVPDKMSISMSETTFFSIKVPRYF